MWHEFLFEKYSTYALTRRFTIRRSFYRTINLYMYMYKKEQYNQTQINFHHVC